jgi:hypothetical protein
LSNLFDLLQDGQPLSLLLLVFKDAATVIILSDLIDQYVLAGLLAVNELNCTFFLLLEAFDAVDFHHVLDAALLLEVILLKHLVLDELFVTNADHPAEHNILIHALDSIELLVHLKLGEWQPALGSLHLLACRARNVFLTILLVFLLHLFTANFRRGLHHLFGVFVHHLAARQLHLDAAQLVR